MEKKNKNRRVCVWVCLHDFQTYNSSADVLTHCWWPQCLSDLFQRGLCVFCLLCRCLTILLGDVRIDHPGDLTCISAPTLSEPGRLLSAQFGTALLRCLGLRWWSQPLK